MPQTIFLEAVWGVMDVAPCICEPRYSNDIFHTCYILFCMACHGNSFISNSIIISPMNSAQSGTTALPSALIR